MKNNIGFFSHETGAAAHRKFLILRTYYGEGEKGWAMDGRFWRLNSLIADADNCKIDTTKKGEKARLAHELGLGLKDLEEFLAVLRDDAELIHDDDGTIWTEQTQADLRRAMTRRQGAKARRDFREYDDELKTSRDESEKDGDEKHGGEGKGVEKIRGKRRASSSPENSKRGEQDAREEAAPPLVDNPVDNSEDADLLAFAIARVKARKKQPGNLEAYARRIMHDPDVIAAYQASLATPSASGKVALVEEPGPCPRCGKPLKADLRRGEAQCLDDDCRVWLKYDSAFGWILDEAEEREEHAQSSA